MRSCFVTGTDTDCGKTLVSCGLIVRLREQGVDAVGMKPVASGSRSTPDGLRNADAEAILAVSGGELAYRDVNPYAFEPAIAPHLAAEQAGVSMAPEVIVASYRRLAECHEAVVVEGVGGWRVPLSAGWSVSDMARDLGLPVVLVIGLRLGCLNHALLSAEAIIADGRELVGWVGNQVDPAMPCLEENLHTLKRLIPAPCLGVVPHLAEPQAARVADFLAAK